MADGSQKRPNYGVDAPGVLRNFFAIGLGLVVLIFITPAVLVLGPVRFAWHPTMAWVAAFLLADGTMMLWYVKVGKFRARDRLLALHAWRGDERVLDVGCGRGLLLAGAAKRLTTGHATGIDIWSNVDMGGNSEAATERNLRLEGLAERCTLVSAPAQAMPFEDGSFDVVVSNLCLHNISAAEVRHEAVREIARVLKPGGVALVCDYKNSAQYERQFREQGMEATRRWVWPMTMFTSLRVVIARRAMDR